MASRRVCWLHLPSQLHHHWCARWWQATGCRRCYWGPLDGACGGMDSGRTSDRSIEAFGRRRTLDRRVARTVRGLLGLRQGSRGQKNGANGNCIRRTGCYDRRVRGFRVHQGRQQRKPVRRQHRGNFARCSTTRDNTRRRTMNVQVLTAIG
jgi:hypothetical protein